MASRKAGRPVSPATPRSGSGAGGMRSLVLRAWVEPPEPGVPPRLRARLLELRADGDPQPLAMTASVEEACQAVRRWLESVRGPAGGETSSDNGDGTVTRQD